MITVLKSRSRPTKRSKAKIYRYYTCCSAQKKGWHSCPSKSVPAGEIERFVVEQIRCVGQDPELLAETLSQASELGRSRVGEFKRELKQLEADTVRWHTEVRKISATGSLDDDGPAIARLAELQELLRQGEVRASELREEIAALSREQVSKKEVAQALSAFDPVWESLTPQEQTRLVQLLVERVEYDGRSEKIAITFHPSGIKSLAIEMANQHEETIA
jgi:site-specific DNA recombinase